MRNEFMNLREMVYAAIFAALSIVVRLLTITVSETFFLSLTWVPVILAGLALGPWRGAAVGAVADALGAILVPRGVPFPGYTLTLLIVGALAGVFQRKVYFEKNQKKMWIWCVAMIVVTELICSTGLNTLWVHISQGKPFIVALIERLPKIPIDIVGYTICVTSLMPLIRTIMSEKKAEEQKEEPDRGKLTKQDE